ncbi:MAG: hypothetical protein Q9219_007339 [cf. Caloplaca sp. 3 TL-2023]
MESIKSALGYGSQSGQEPVSGETGKGTADQPYDAGNVEGQSGASASEVTSTNPTGTTQYDTGDGTKSTSLPDRSQGATKMTTTETLAAGVTGGDSNVRDDDPAITRPTGSTSGAVAKGDDENRGPDEQVTSNRSGPGSDNNTNAQDAFFSKADIAKDKPAAPPKVTDEINNKDPFASSSNDTPSTTTTADQTTQPASTTTKTDTATTSSSPSLEKIGSTAPEKAYQAADTEPHPQSSEVLSSATPGAALDSPPASSNTQQTTNPSDPSNTTGKANYNDNTTNTTGSAPTTTATTTTAATDTDYPSPKTQPSEAHGGLSGLSHNTGAAPTAPDTGSDAVEDPTLGASQGQGKKKMGERIKEKLHIGGSGKKGGGE